MSNFVCFDDSDSNPTFIGANNAFLVESNSSNENPCLFEEAETIVPVMPSNLTEILGFARIQGWEVIIANGVIHLNTGISVI